MYSIALQMLFGDRGKFIAMVVGITFAALIMTQQPAIYFGLMRNTQSYVRETSAPDNIWVMDPSVQFVEEDKPLRDTELQRVRGIEGVDWAVPLYQGILTALLPDGSRKVIDITGVDDATLVGAPRIMLQGKIADLRQQDGIILDKAAAEDRYAYTDKNGVKHSIKVGDVLEINDHRAVVVGIAKLKPTFTLNPLAFTTYTRALSYAPPERRMLSYILVKPRKGVAPQKLIERIRDRLQLAAYTTDAFAQINTDYWFSNTGIPVNFGISVLLGFLVGAAVAGQTFFNFVRESLKHFAVLKALGVGNGQLVGMVLLDAAVVGAIGYGLGVGMAGLFGIAVHNSVLAYSMSWKLLAFTAAGVGIIVTLAGLAGMRSVLRLDPAVVFRS